MFEQDERGEKKESSLYMCPITKLLHSVPFDLYFWNDGLGKGVENSRKVNDELD